MNKRLLQIIFITATSMLFFMGCEDLLNSDDVSAEDSIAAIAETEAATAALEEVMQAMFDADPDSVQDIIDIMDFSAPYDLYSSAHELDPANSDANFGLAFTGFLRLTQDQDLQDMVLRWESYFNANEPFLVDDGLGKIGYGMPTSIGGIRVPVARFIETPLAMSRMSIDDVPQFSEFQAMVNTLFLPIIEESITALELIDNDPNYVFTISPAMQGLSGDPDVDPMELDLTEVYALEMGLYALKGVLKTVVAYNFDIVSFDSVGIVTELSQGSDFATLHTDGAASLSEALLSMNTAFERAIDALDFLESETDNQSDDLITFEFEEDLIDIRNGIEEVQAGLMGPTLIHYSYSDCNEYDEWDDCVDETWVDDSITVDISQFFDNPIQDFKAMLPPYIMGTQIYYDHEWMEEFMTVHYEEASVSVLGLSNTQVDVNMSYYIDEFGDPIVYAWVNVGPFGYDLATAPTENVPAAVWDAYTDFQNLITQYSGEEYDYFNAYFNWSGQVTTLSSLVIDADFWYNYELRGSSYVEPRPEWVATNYTDWLAGWPDPTMNGILPGMDAAGLADFLGVDAENWE